jgi:hypothetical protein
VWIPLHLIIAFVLLCSLVPLFITTPPYASFPSERGQKTPVVTTTWWDTSFLLSEQSKVNTLNIFNRVFFSSRPQRWTYYTGGSQRAPPTPSRASIRSRQPASLEYVAIPYGVMNFPIVINFCTCLSLTAHLPSSVLGNPSLIMSAVLYANAVAFSG